MRVDEPVCRRRAPAAARGGLCPVTPRGRARPAGPELCGLQDEGHRSWEPKAQRALCGRRASPNPRLRGGRSAPPPSRRPGLPARPRQSPLCPLALAPLLPLTAIFFDLQNGRKWGALC